MRIAKDALVTLRQRVIDSEGRVIDEGDEPIRYLHGGYGGIFAPLEQVLEGKQAGDTIQVSLSPEAAYGAPDPTLVAVASPGSFAEPPRVGDQVERNFGASPVRYRVVAVEDGRILLDANHLLAGKALVFSATVVEVRSATAAEIAAELSSLTKAVAEAKARARAMAEAKATAQAETEAAKLAQAEAAGLVETSYLPQLDARLRFVFRSQTHKLCWQAPLFLLPATGAWLGYRGWELACGAVVVLWLAWTFFAPAAMGMAIDRWGYRFLFFDFSPNLAPSRLESGIVAGSAMLSVLAVTIFTVFALFKIEHWSEIWEIIGVDIFLVFALGALVGILLPFLVVVLTGFRVRPVIDKIPS